MTDVKTCNDSTFAHILGVILGEGSSRGTNRSGKLFTPSVFPYQVREIMQSTYDFPGSGNFLNGAYILESSNFPLSALKDEHANGELRLPLAAEHHSNIISMTTQRALLRLISTPLLD